MGCSATVEKNNVMCLTNYEAPQPYVIVSDLLCYFISLLASEQFLLGLKPFNSMFAARHRTAGNT